MSEELRTYWISWANGNINALQKLIEKCPELAVLIDTPQSYSLHQEGDCARHTILTCEAANELAETIPHDCRRMFRYAALLHDIGKPYCIIKAAPGIYSYPDLSKVSFTMARIILDKYTQIPVRERESILALINNISMPTWLVQRGRPIRDLQRISMECDLQLLYNLAKANYMGRMTTNLRERFEELETFKMWCTSQNMWDGKSWDGLLSIDCFKKFGKSYEVAKSIVDWFYLDGVIFDNIDAQNWLSFQKSWYWGTLFMTVGPPGAGKTTWVSKNYPMLPIVSSDKIRLELTGDMADQSQNDRVFELAAHRINEYLLQGKQVVYDATNLRYNNRRNFIDLARNLGTNIVILFFSTSYDVCLSRIKTRAQLPLTKEILDEMYKNFDYVSSYEYNKIFYI